VLAYPGGGWNTYGYTNADLAGTIALPGSVDEDLVIARKPAAQAQSLLAMAGLGVLGTAARQTDYLNFYGNLLCQADARIGQDLDALDARGLTDSTIVVRVSDHGEMGMAHGGLRQKMFNVYEETIRIPFVISNPVLFPEARETAQLASQVDLMPTIATLARVTPVQGLQGNDLSPVVTDPDLATPIQTEIAFTYDDVRAGQPNRKALVNAADRIRCIRESRWKYARYFNAEGSYPEEIELYDLDSDPEETTNLAYSRDPAVVREHERLARKLAETEARIAARPAG
jgi:choline-sulfatase